MNVGHNRSTMARAHQIKIEKKQSRVRPICLTTFMIFGSPSHTDVDDKSIRVI
jgi:hypothetical protein